MSNYSAQQSSISENNRFRICNTCITTASAHVRKSKAVGLTPAAITKITAKLLAQNIIEETGDMEGGKDSSFHRFESQLPGKYHVIGLKFARSLVQIGLFDLKMPSYFAYRSSGQWRRHQRDSQTDPQHHSSPHRQRRENRGSRHGSPRTIPCRRRAYRTRLLHAGLAQSQFHQGIQRSL